MAKLLVYPSLDSWEAVEGTQDKQMPKLGQVFAGPTSLLYILSLASSFATLSAEAKTTSYGSLGYLVPRGAKQIWVTRVIRIE